MTGTLLLQELIGSSRAATSSSGSPAVRRSAAWWAAPTTRRRTRSWTRAPRRAVPAAPGSSVSTGRRGRRWGWAGPGPTTREPVPHRTRRGGRRWTPRDTWMLDEHRLPARAVTARHRPPRLAWCAPTGTSSHGRPTALRADARSSFRGRSPSPTGPPGAGGVHPPTASRCGLPRPKRCRTAGGRSTRRLGRHRAGATRRGIDLRRLRARSPTRHRCPPRAPRAVPSPSALAGTTWRRSARGDEKLSPSRCRRVRQRPGHPAAAPLDAGYRDGRRP